MKDTSIDWKVYSKKTLDWFLAHLGPDEWDRRRKGVVEYFNGLYQGQIDPRNKITNGTQFYPLAVYEDWISWYMYLVESVSERPFVDEPFQSARIYPFFAAIGRYVDELKAVSGINDRLDELLNKRQNSPDSTLFEISIVALYLKNGWKVRFLKEQKDRKTPDIEVEKNGKIYFVECKRLAKVPEYADVERAAWQIRFRHLTNAMQLYGVNAAAEVIFKVPVEDTPEESVGAALYQYQKVGMFKTGQWLRHEMFDFRARIIDVEAINRRLSDLGARDGSPQMIELINGEFDMHGNYTHLLSPTEIFEVGPDDGLHVLNRFIYGIQNAYAAKWKCIAPSSIDKKARDFKKILSKAVSQIPDGGNGIIHVGYETVMGPEVEMERHKKAIEMINNFKFNEKSIEAVYLHAIQPLRKLDEWECAETTLHFEKTPGTILTENLLLDPPGIRAANATHWEQDLEGY